MILSSKKAMTLVEAMLVVLISCFIIGGLYTTLIVGNRSWLVYSDNVVLKQEVRGTLFLLANDLREAKNIHIESSSEKVELTFYRPSKGNIQYHWEKEGERPQQLIREYNQEQKVFAQHIVDFSLEQDPESMVITLLARKKSFTGENIEFQMKQKIALRSKTPIFK